MKAFASASVFAAALAMPASGLAGDGWKVQLEKNGVTISARPVSFSKIAEVRGEAVFDLPAEDIFRVLTDVEAYPGRMPTTIAARRIEGGAEPTWYMEIQPPMISKRYYCLRVKNEKTPSGTLRSEWRLANDRCPASQRGMVRIEDNAGAWTLVPEGANRTRVIYQAHTDPGGEVLPSLVNWGTVQALPDLFSAIRKATAKQVELSRR